MRVRPRQQDIYFIYSSLLFLHFCSTGNLPADVSHTELDFSGASNVAFIAFLESEFLLKSALVWVLAADNIYFESALKADFFSTKYHSNSPWPDFYSHFIMSALAIKKRFCLRVIKIEFESWNTVSPLVFIFSLQVFLCLH